MNSYVSRNTLHADETTGYISLTGRRAAVGTGYVTHQGQQKQVGGYVSSTGSTFGRRAA
ncbi:hypothetical protein [Cryobacterium psychrophilum]|uniref:hypothetical protein n=1 Tax=Cryobacterium psychrophilum TaxID=41988 RepID=UPI0010D0DF47|nr:hypothetical protein [Cryobacterium psychrophilum]TDW29040.1 hypothetical protein EDD25_0717 [Cryobacterium psychrophilum]